MAVSLFNIKFPYINTESFFGIICICAVVGRINAVTFSTRYQYYLIVLHPKITLGYIYILNSSSFCHCLFTSYRLFYRNNFPSRSFSFVVHSDLCVFILIRISLKIFLVNVCVFVCRSSSLSSLSSSTSMPLSEW